MTQIIDPRGALLHAFDAHAAAFIEAHSGQARAARGEVEILAALADAIPASLALWARLCERLDLAREPGRDLIHAGALVLECVFDDLLTPPALRVLGAALELAEGDA